MASIFTPAVCRFIANKNCLKFPVFKIGDDPQIWIRIAEQFFVCYDVPDQSKVSLVSYYIEKVVLDWMNIDSLFDTDWEDFATILYDEFHQEKYGFNELRHEEQLKIYSENLDKIEMEFNYCDRSMLEEEKDSSSLKIAIRDEHEKEEEKEFKHVVGAIAEPESSLQGESPEGPTVEKNSQKEEVEQGCTEEFNQALTKIQFIVSVPHASQLRTPLTLSASTKSSPLPLAHKLFDRMFFHNKPSPQTNPPPSRPLPQPPPISTSPPLPPFPLDPPPLNFSTLPLTFHTYKQFDIFPQPTKCFHNKPISDFSSHFPCRRYFLLILPPLRPPFQPPNAFLVIDNCKQFFVPSIDLRTGQSQGEWNVYRGIGQYMIELKHILDYLVVTEFHLDCMNPLSNMYIQCGKFCFADKILNGTDINSIVVILGINEARYNLVVVVILVVVILEGVALDYWIVLELVRSEDEHVDVSFAESYTLLPLFSNITRGEIESLEKWVTGASDGHSTVCLKDNLHNFWVRKSRLRTEIWEASSWIVEIMKPLCILEYALPTDNGYIECFPYEVSDLELAALLLNKCIAAEAKTGVWTAFLIPFTAGTFVGLNLYASIVDSSCTALFVAPISTSGIKQDFTANCYTILFYMMDIIGCLIIFLLVRVQWFIAWSMTKLALKNCYLMFLNMTVEV